MTKEGPLKDSIKIMRNVKRHHSFFANNLFLCLGLDANHKLCLDLLCPL